MAIVWTLQYYILREMAKTFLMASVALTAVLGLGGGVLNMMKLGDVTAGQLLTLIALVLPLAAALTLPVAAMFSATSTYGRFSADNEFVACRSSGINMHVLFLPSLMISLLAATVSFAFSSYVVPSMVRNLNSFVSADFASMIRQGLDEPRGIKVGDNYRVYADRAISDPDDPNRIVLQGVAFIEVEGAEWIRYGTFRELHLTFDSKSKPMRVHAVALDVSWYDRKAEQFVEDRRQTISSNEIPTLVPQKIKFLMLTELFQYLAEPTRWIEVREKMGRLRQAVGRAMVYEALHDRWRADKSLTLPADDPAFTLRADVGQLVPRAGGIDFHGNIEVVDHRLDRRITAERAVLEVTRGEALSDSRIKVNLYAARLTSGDTTIERERETLAAIAIDPAIIRTLAAISDHDLLNPVKGSDPQGGPVAARRAEAEAERGKTVRRIIGVINERLAFSVSVFVLVILGAVLGITFRGSHLMTAFGISFVPSVFVIVGIVAGKQLCHNADTHVLGLLTMWAGIVLVAMLDGWTLTYVLRR